MTNIREFLQGDNTMTLSLYCYKKDNNVFLMTRDNYRYGIMFTTSSTAVHSSNRDECVSVDMQLIKMDYWHKVVQENSTLPSKVLTKILLSENLDIDIIEKIRKYLVNPFTVKDPMIDLQLDFK